MSAEADVLVVGAGASGIPAAVAAARAGARVVLLDEDPMVGGAPTDMFVAAFCGYPRSGVVREMEERLAAAHRLAAGAHWYLPHSWQTVAEELLSEADVTVLRGARAVGAIVEGTRPRPRVAGVLVQRRGPPREVRAAVTVDATGTGRVAVDAGCPAMYGEDSRDDFGETPAPPQRTANVQWVTWMYISQRLPRAKPLDMMKLEHARRGVLVNGLGWYHNDPEKARRLDVGVYLHWGCAVECEDTRDPVCLGDAQRHAMRAMERDHALLREHGYAIYMAPRIGVREANRVVTEHIVTLGDLCSGRKPPDTIAMGAYGIDIWGQAEEGSPASRIKIPPYGIPYRALVPRDADGLLVTGKAIGGTHIAMSAYRVMPIVGAIGQSTGVAAALCAAGRLPPRDLDPRRVQTLLTQPPQNLRLDAKTE